MDCATLLLVDDEPEILDALRRTLRSEGHHVMTATSPGEALELLAHAPVDVLLTDIRMPDMSGLELLTEVKRSYPRVVRLLLTGVPSLESAVAAINEGGAYRFLVKPWDPDELRTTIAQAIEHSRASRRTPVPPAVEALPPRLRQTLEELMTGATEKQVAQRLAVSPHTVHAYVKALHHRFAVSSRAELIMCALGLSTGGARLRQAE